MDHANTIITKHCTHNDVSAAELLGTFLKILQSSHMMHSVNGFAQNAKTKDKPSVINEIRGMLTLLSISQADIPASLLATLDLPLKANHWMATANAENARQQGDEKTGAVLERRAVVIETMRLILKDLINAAETQGLAVRLNLEGVHQKLADEQKKKKDKPDEPKPDA